MMCNYPHRYGNNHYCIKLTFQQSLFGVLLDANLDCLLGLDEPSDYDEGSYGLISARKAFGMLYMAGANGVSKGSKFDYANLL